MSNCALWSKYWIDDFFNSISSTLPISEIARLDSSLNTIFSSARSSRIQILFEPIFSLSISWLFASLFENASVMTSCSLRWVPTSTFETVRLMFPTAISTSVAFFVSSRTPALLSQIATSFEMLSTPSMRVSCCCCVSQLLFNVTFGAGFGVASLSNDTRSPFGEITRWTQSPGTVSQVMIANNFVCQNCNPRYCALDNLSNVLHLDCLSNKFYNVLEEQCNHHEVSLHLGCYRMDPEVWRRLLVEALSFSFPPGICPLQNRLKISRNSSVKDVLLPFVWNTRVV